MRTRSPLVPLLALTLSVACGCAMATETGRHNDLNGDGRSDLIWRNGSTGALVMWSGAFPTLATTLRLQVPVAGGLTSARWPVVMAYQFRPNYPNDLLLQDAAGIGMELESSEAGPYTGYYNVYPAGLYASPDWKLVGVGHFDTDLWAFGGALYRNQRDGSNAICCTYTDADDNWGVIATPVPLTRVTNLAWQVAGIGDFNGDLVADVLWRNAVTGANAVWLAANAGNQLRVTSVTNLDWKIAAVGDFNGDGRVDIFWRNARSGANAIWKSGNAATQQAVTSVPNLAWQVATTGDFDRDGKVDVVWRNTSTGANTIWLSANSATQRPLPSVNLAWQLVK